MQIPRGYRNFNPGNIEDGPFARSLPGYAGGDGRFARFNSYEDGANAADQLLQTYGRKGINTIDGVINRWAPPSDNNPTSAYSNHVATAMGFAPNQPFDMNDPEKRSALAQAMFAFENGGPRPSPEAMAMKASAGNVSLGGEKTKQGPESLKADVTPSAAPFAMPAASGSGESDQWSRISRSLVGAGAALQSATNPEGAAAMARLYAQMGEGDGSFGLHFEPTTGQVFRLNKKTGEITAQQGLKPKMETEWDKLDTKMWHERNSQIGDSANKARERLNTLAEARKAVENPAVYQGFGGEAWLGVKKAFSALTGKPIDGVSESEVFDTIAKTGALDLRNPLNGGGMPGALSNSDRDYLAKSNYGLGTSREGNLKIIEHNEKLAKRAIEYDQWRQEYMATKGRLDNGFVKFAQAKADASPLFSNETAALGKAPDGSALKKKYGLE